MKSDHTRGKRTELIKYADDGFAPPDKWNNMGLIRVEVRRLRASAFVAVVAAQTPRRLGKGVDSSTLAADTYLSRGIAHTYYNLWRGLCIGRRAYLPPEELGEGEQDLYPPEDWNGLYVIAAKEQEAVRVGRTVNWEEWWRELQPRLRARRRALATYGIKQQELSMGYRLVVNITRELDWIETKFQVALARTFEQEGVA